MTIHTTHYKCPVCKYEYKKKFNDQSPVVTKILKGDEEFIHLRGTFTQPNIFYSQFEQVTLLACPKCLITQLCPFQKDRATGRKSK